MCECVLIFFFLVILSATGFNIDQKNYAVFEPRDNNNSMFGFTVAMHKASGNRGWILVGAPEGQSIYQDASAVTKGGTVYKCQIDRDDVCQQIPFDRTSNVGFVGSALDEKSGQWFGATLSTSGRTDGPVVACAPRYVWFTKDLNRKDPVGTCFVSNGAFDSFEEYSPCRTMNWGYHRQGSCQAGFSAAINREGDRLYVGAPGSYYWQGQMYSIDAHAHFNYTPGFFGNRGYGAKGSVHQQSLENRPAVFSTREGKAPDDDSYIGYSTVVGHFKQGEEFEGIAVGMPRGNKLKGKVLLFTWNLNNYKNITISDQIGSYFGYSLTAADVNGDKKLDLVVGAPMHTEPNTENKYDVGRVYVFYQSSDSVESFNSSDFIDGTNSKGRFGHALASLGDLNQDGYDDFAVGAPYDGPQGRGAVYIFYGSKAGVRKKFGQVIYAEQVGGYLSTFGFSVAGGLDLDNNEYPDMAVGAYLSNSAFFFRARPVVFIDSSVRFLTPNKRIDLKQKNCRLPNGDGGTCTSIDFCIKYFGKGIPDQLSLNVEYLLDTKAKISRMRFKKLGTHTFNRTLVLRKDGVESCRTEEIYIKEDIRDKLTPLEAEVNFYMVDEDTFYQQLRNPLSQLRPVLDLNNPPSRKDSITIQNNCGVDNVCIPNLHLNVTSNIQEYLLGSNTTIEFTVIVSNFGQDSFETTFEMKYPATGIFYKKTVIKIPGVSCTETSNKTVLCDIGNPLPKDKIANFSIFFQPYHQGGFPNRSYVFDMLVNSSNPELPFTVEDNTKHIEIDIWIDATIDIKGQSYASLQPLSTYNNTIFKGSIKEATKETDIGPQITHVYYLTNKGPSQIQEAEVFLLWPLTTLSGDDLLYLLEQPITKGNIKCDLSPLVNYKKLKLEPQSTTIWDKLKIDISSFTSSTSSFQTSEKHEGGTIETGMGVGSGIGVVNQDQNKINTAVNTSGGDSSYITELRHNETTSSEHVRTWGTLNPNGQYEYTVSKYYTVMENGAPVTKWENTTTIRDATGRIISTLYHNDYEGSRTGGLNPLNYVVGLRQGEYEHKTARYFTTYDSAGNPTTRWQNKTVVTDLNGNVLRSYVWDESTGEYKLEAGGSDGYNREEQLRRQQQERIEEARRRKLEEERYEESRRQEERKRLEERKRIEEERIRLEEARRAEEKRKTDELRRQDEQRRRQEQQAREEEWRREQEKRRLEEIRRQGGTNRYDEERRREEERARQEEWSRQQARIAEERRRQDQIRMNEERRRQEQARYEERLKQQEQQRRINQQRHQQGSTEGDRRHYDQQTRQHSSQGGSSSSGNNVITGYFDQDGKYVARNPNELVFNKTYVFESSTTIPIDISGGKTFVGNGGNFNDLGSGFTVQTLDLGGGTKAGSQANGRESGGYNREWQAQGGYSTSGRIPPTFIHNNVQDQPLESTRFKRQIPNDPYADIKALVKCNSTKCIYIRCVVGALDRDQDVLIALRSRLNVRGLKDLAGSDEAIRLSSKMVSAITDLPYVEPVKKEKQVWKEYEIFTEVPAKEAELAQKVVPLWIYVVSAVAGVVMLLLLIWLLSKCGFFKRNRPSSGPERQPLNRNGYHSGDEAL